MEEFGGEVSAVLPDDGVELRMEAEIAKPGDVLERLEDRPPKFIFQVDFAFSTIVES
jgi:hypothetical protein